MRPTHAGLFHVTARSIAEEHVFQDDRLAVEQLRLQVLLRPTAAVARNS